MYYNISYDLRINSLYNVNGKENPDHIFLKWEHHHC